jgi:F420-dependent oxidoreductase-like protein
MDLPRVGLNLTENETATAGLAAIQRAEDRGVPMLWAITGRDLPDALTLFAAAAARTQRIGLGTAIVPTYPRHPVVLAAQVQVVDQLAPGRFRLGIGTSHRPTITGAMGIPMGRPLAHLREYLAVLRPLLWNGEVDFDGEYYSVHIRMQNRAPVPIYISALRLNAFRLAGDAADGAISWLSPLSYLRDRAIPAMRAAAGSAGRPTPRMVAQIPVVMGEDRTIALQAARRRIGGYAQLPFYAKMFTEAGFPPGPDGEMSDDLIDHLIVSGTDSQVRDRLAAALGGGIDELLVMQIPARNLQDEEARLSSILASLV